MQQLTANVYVETKWVSGTHAGAGSNSSFLVTSGGIVMIDTPLVPANAITWRNIMSKKGKLLYVINTGSHSDHSSGNYFFPAPIVAHEKTREAIPGILVSDDAQRQKLQRNYPACADLVEDYRIRLPSITFSERLHLYAGDHTLELIHLPGHTPGEIGVYLPEERVIITGDNFGNGRQPKLSDCNPLEQMDSLERILEMEADHFVPGHGEVGDKQAVRDHLSIIQGCVDTVWEAIERGMPREEAINRLRLPFPDGLMFLHPEREQQMKDIGRLYDVLSDRKSKVS